MYLILSKEDFETRSVDSKEGLIPENPLGLRVLNPEGVSIMHLGSNKVKRLIEPRKGRVYFPDKPEGWKDEDCIFLGCTYSDIKTVGGIVMHKEEAAKLVEYLYRTLYADKEDSYYMIETMGPY